ncbi:glutamate receptor ionotropic, kainate 4-like [Oppia nitens]|uniref:glutamate receptor ionotropic, kainate 4-like n=1 Tax=Oppia nitens TaxID=1686743 RepID=UPI0023DA5FAA|nr:glutamate receptor ionotropic, kainate 4-like [Oppia nitens]XP_054160582.1 glutamate receptor ionotropic, kainate 4-like [Oppia nitens]
MYANNCIISTAIILTTIVMCVQTLDNDGKPLRGVTIVSPPFVMKSRDNQFEGFTIDLLKEIAKILKFEYTLYPSPDDRYGATDSKGKPSGMIQELFMRRAEFAIADLTIGEIRQRYIDYSEPFLDLDLSILINKKNIGNITSFEDLANQTRIRYGTIREGETYRSMSMSSDPTIIRINNYIYSNAFNLVNSREEGVQNTLNTEYAFIQESVANEYAADQNCELTIIHDKKNYYSRQYAIGLQKGSPFKPEFDRAIKQLKSDGTVDKLKRRYWKTKCLSGAVTAKLDIITTISLIASALISYILFN